MPTVIDSLIIELGLQPSGFTEAEKATLGSLHSINLQLAKSNEALDKFAQQSRRSGQGIKAGNDIGAQSFKGLAVAATEAYGAMKTVEVIIGRVADASRRGAEVGRQAWAIGVPVKELDAYIQAAEAMANIPQATTTGALNQFQQKRAEWQRTGQWSQEFTELQRLGVTFTGPLWKTLNEVAGALQKRPGPETQAWVNAVGLGPLLQYLKLSLQQRQAAETRAAGTDPLGRVIGGRSLTDEQSQSLARLQSAATEFNQSLTHMFEVLVGKFGDQGFTNALHGWSMLFDYISNANAGLERFLDILKDIADIFKYGPLAPLIIASRRAGIIGGGTPAPGMAPDTRGLWERYAPTILGGKPAPGRVFSAPIPGAGGALPQAAFDAISGAEGTRGPKGIDYDAIYGGTAPGLSNATLADVLKFQQARIQRGESSAVGGFQIMHGTLKDAIAAAKLDPNTMRFTPEIQRQFTSWLAGKRGGQPWEGFKAHPEELRKFNDAMSSMGGGALTSFATGNARPGGPSDVTGVHPEVAARIQSMIGMMPPDIERRFRIESGVRTFEHNAAVGGARDSHHLPTHRSAVDLAKDPAVLAWIRQNGWRAGLGFPISWDINHMEPLDPTGRRMSDQALSNAWMIRSSRANAAGGGAQRNVNNDVDNNVNIGNLNVHTQATDAEGTALAIGGALQRHAVVHGANSGVEQ